MDYTQVAKDVLQHVGGKENIAHLEHCSTRLRFTLIDQKKADVPALEKTPGVIAVRMSGQCQVVIGNDVIEVYQKLTSLIGSSHQGRCAFQSAKEKKSRHSSVRFHCRCLPAACSSYRRRRDFKIISSPFLFIRLDGCKGPNLSNIEHGRGRTSLLPPFTSRCNDCQ